VEYWQSWVMEKWDHEGEEAVGRPPAELEELEAPMGRETAGCMRGAPRLTAQGNIENAAGASRPCTSSSILAVCDSV